MATKLIFGEKAEAAERLVWADTRGATRQPSTTRGNQNQNRPGEEEQASEILALRVRIQELEREMDIRPKQAYQQGYDEGQTAGTQQTAARFEPVMAKLALTIKDLAGVRKRHLIEAEEDAVRLSVAIARRILHRELSVDPESVLGVVKAAFERVDARDVHRIRLHPEDVPVLQRHLVTVGMPPRVELIADTSLERGSVIVETNRGSLDASVSSQLREIERGLVDIVRRGS